MINDYFVLAFRNLRRRGLRSWLTMLGIFISIATIFVLISLSLGLQNAVQEQFRLLGTDKIIIMSKGSAGAPGSSSAAQLSIKDVETIDKVAGVKDLSYATIANAEVSHDNQKRFVMVVGFPLDRSDVFTETGAYKADEGALFSKTTTSGSVMLGSQYKYNSVFSKPIHAGDKIFINGVEFKVKTILQSVGNPSDDKNVLMSLEDFKKVFNTGDRVDQIMVQVQPGESVSQVSDRIAKRLRQERGVTEKTEDFILLTPEELLSSFDVILNIVTAFLVGVASISLLVGSIGIANTMYTSVLERTREIGVMKAVGAKNSDILQIFLIESGLLGFVGGLIGIILGFALAKGVEYYAINVLGTTLLKAAVPFYLVAGCLVFSFLIGAVSGTWPAWNASKIKPVDALRYE